MDYKLLAELLFPHVTKTPEEIEALYPARQLPEGAKVTRFAPSPTGFVHFGGLFPTLVGERLAHQSGGVFYLRIEDTDAKREVEGAAESLIKTFNYYGINFDEGAILDENGNLTDCGDYGPYKQSKRVDIYHVFAKKLVEEGKAYPVFTTKEELEALNAVDKKADTFLYLDNFKKGFVVINGFNLGRYWEIGPQRSLYVPASILNEGENEIVIFEADGLKGEPTIEFKDYPTLQ